MGDHGGGGRRPSGLSRQRRAEFGRHVGHDAVGHADEVEVGSEFDQITQTGRRRKVQPLLGPGPSRGGGGGEAREGETVRAKRECQACAQATRADDGET